MELLWLDFRHALRSLRNSPSFSAIVVITLALGIGANSAIFTMIYGLLLRPLPYANPHTLVSVWDSQSHSAGELEAIRVRSKSYQELAAFTTEALNLSSRGDAHRIQGSAVTSELFTVLGTQPIVGRTLRTGDDEPGHEPVVVLSYHLWKQDFGGDANVVGQRIVLDDLPRTVVGVMPSEFYFPSSSIDVWIPAVFDARALSAFWGSGGYQIVARLSPNTSVDRAANELHTLAPLVGEDNPIWNPGPSYGTNADVISLRDHMSGAVRTPLLVLSGAVFLVLLIACANVASLIITRMAARSQALAIRLALGASRSRVARQMFLETLLLATIGALAGLVLAKLSMTTLSQALVADAASAGATTINSTVIAASLALSMLTAIVVGLFPSVSASRLDIKGALNSSSRGGGPGMSRRSPTDSLVVIEVGLAFVLVVSALLLIRSFQDLSKTDPGFDANLTVTARVTLGPSRFEKPSERLTFYSALLSQLRALPGVSNVGAISELPLSGDLSGFAFRVQGQVEDLHRELPSGNYHVITGGYLQAMGIPIIKGRDFSDSDLQGGPPVVLVSQSLARKFWPGLDPIGQRIGPPYEGAWETIVGVVGDVADQSLRDHPPMAIYRPFAQLPRLSMSLAVRGTRSSSLVPTDIRKAVAGLDAGVPVSDVRTLSDIISRSVEKPRLMARLLSVFAIIALILGAVGIYGVMTQWVARRTRDVGIRLALGATPRDVVALVVRRGVILALVGVVCGAPASVILTSALRTLLYGVQSTDTFTFLATPLLILAITAVASYVPAQRAAATNPMKVMRTE